MSEHVYTDGSCHRNGQPDAKAGWAVFFDDYDGRNASGTVEGGPQTNNVAELMAIWNALDIIQENCYEGDCYSIFTDSTYAKNACTKWGRIWENNGWVTASGKPVKNRGLIEDIREKTYDLQDMGVRVYFQLCASHGNGPYGNQMADAMANQAIEDYYQNCYDSDVTEGCECSCHYASSSDGYY